MTEGEHLQSLGLHTSFVSDSICAELQVATSLSRLCRISWANGCAGYHNGPEASGDGYKYRGRGLIQTTFKANYEVFNREHNHRFPDDQKDFLDNPDLLLSNLEYGVESAFVYWVITRSVNPVADTGDVAAVTQQINGGQNGHAERLIAYNKVAPLLGLPQETN